ncbi:MAG: polyprenyl synthetase family protein [Clostridia bacterium]|nr:polyprenyl synthetase family protein [Clostridia bacterium]
MNFNDKFSEYREFINKSIDNLFAEYDDDTVCKDILEAAKYAVNNGGKRIRPILCIVAAEALGIKKDNVLNFALAIELIHSYSLVHDDLPAMDNDDFRRGKLATHKKFGEAMGILAGDALLNLAAETVLTSIDNESKEAAAFIFKCSGMKGMIAGQVYDLQSEKCPEFSENFLYKISRNKTSALLTAPLVVPAMLSGEYVSEFKSLGEKIGILFQITDDIFDETGEFTVIGKTPHKDGNKVTAISVFGLDGAKEKARELYSECKKILSVIPNSEFLSQIVDYVYTRKN